MINISITENDYKLLAIIKWLSNHNGITKREDITYMVKNNMPEIEELWENIMNELIRNKILCCNADGSYCGTEEGMKYLHEAEENNLITSSFYNNFFRYASKSKAHSKFCKLAYGKDLCQHGLLDMIQLDKLLMTAGLTECSNVLELGCGNGYITEYISDITGCRILGTDLSNEAVEQAMERTKHKRNRLNFSVVNMDCMVLPENTFDAILAIDSLYFVNSLENVLQTATSSLKLHGKLYLFYVFKVNEDIAGDETIPDLSFLAKTLMSLKLPYVAYDYTEENRNHWINKQNILENMKAEFESEGNMFLYNNRLEENLDHYEEFYRYLYVVERTR